MNFPQAVEKMKKGKVVKSQVSNTTYKFKGYVLCAGSIHVDFDYITDAEADGVWEEVC